MKFRKGRTKLKEKIGEIEGENGVELQKKKKRASLFT